MDRKDLILKYIDKSMKGIEIGPSYNPLCPKREGWNVYVVDHADREELVRKYEKLRERGNTVCVHFGTSQIEKVDLVWKEGSLAKLLGDKGVTGVDFIIASHVIEHVPCLASFLQSMEQIVGEEGVISLAIPDRRRTFDFFKPISTTADVIEAYRQERSRHSVRAGLLQLFYDCSRGAEYTWSDDPPVEELSLVHDFAEASAAFSTYNFSENSPYLDFHAWFFTPASFELILLELNGFGLTKLVIREISDTMGCEFFAHLVRAKNPLRAEIFHEKRMELIRKVHEEYVELELHAPAEHAQTIKALEAALKEEKSRADGFSAEIESLRAEHRRLTNTRGYRLERFLRRIASFNEYDAAYYVWKEYRKKHIDRHDALITIGDRYGVRSFFLLYPLYKTVKPFRKLGRFLVRIS